MAVETVEYRVRRGDSLQDIVQTAGFPRRDWRRIYDAPYNRRLRAQRPDPDAIQPGDVVFLPRYNQRQLADIAARIQMVERRLGLLDREWRTVHDGVSDLKRRLDANTTLTEREMDRYVAEIQRKSRSLEQRASDAAAACIDLRVCLDGMRAMEDLHALGRLLRTRLQELKTKARRGERVLMQSMDKVMAVLREIERARTATGREVTRLRGLYRGAAQNPY